MTLDERTGDSGVVQVYGFKHLSTQPSRAVIEAPSEQVRKVTWARRNETNCVLALGGSLTHLAFEKNDIEPRQARMRRRKAESGRINTSTDEKESERLAISSCKVADRFSACGASSTCLAILGSCPSSVGADVAQARAQSQRGRSLRRSRSR